MDHQEATQLMAVEKYVLNELPPQLRDDFEEHYFDCQECAKDIRAATAFLDAAKIELKASSSFQAISSSVRETPSPMALESLYLLSPHLRHLCCSLHIRMLWYIRG